MISVSQIQLPRRCGKTRADIGEVDARQIIVDVDTLSTQAHGGLTWLLAAAWDEPVLF